MLGRKKSNSRENPISKLFRNYALKTFDYVTTEFNTNHLDIYELDPADGTRFRGVDPNRVTTELQAFSKPKKNCLETSGNAWAAEYFRGRLPTPDERATTLLKQCRRPSGWEPDSPLKEWISHFVYEFENGVDLDDLGRASFAGEDSVFDFGLEQFFQNDVKGSSSIYDQFIRDHLSGVQIVKDTRVTRVRYAKGKHVKTVARSLLGNSICKQVFRSKFVILTPSLDVLRNQITFKPTKPIRTALDKHPIEITTMEKLWIKFSARFWDNNKPFVGLANNQENGKASVFVNMNYFFQTGDYANNNVLLCFVSEDMLTDLGNTGGELSVAQVALHIADLLKVANDKGISVTWSSVMTNFKGDPNFLGSWEVWKFQKTYRDFFEAIAPLNNKLFFAGAGHCNRYWGFTWGAIVSGATVGGWVADKAKGNNNAPRPYSPCDDGNVVSNARWDAFYRANPFFAPK